jgi:hypothetical protein
MSGGLHRCFQGNQDRYEMDGSRNGSVVTKTSSTLICCRVESCPAGGATSHGKETAELPGHTVKRSAGIALPRHVTHYC